MSIRPYGDTALLVETDAPLALAAALSDGLGLPGVVPAARTVLVPLVADRRRTEELIRVALAAPAEPVPPREVTIDVTYDGADLDAVAAETGLSATEVVDRHAGADYTVAFCGFSPGFAYLTGLPAVLHLPRLATPRTRVPAGSVAIAGGYAGIYPRSSPGGWRLLGHTDAPLWNLDRDPPGLLVPGTRVRFRPA